MKTLRVGALLEPQYTTFSSYAEAVRQVEIGCLVTCNSYHNPNFLATMAKLFYLDVTGLVRSGQSGEYNATQDHVALVA